MFRVNQRSGKGIYINFSGVSFWIAALAVIVLLSSIGLGWILKSIFFLLLFLLLAPIVALVIFQWWLKRNVIEDRCPACNTSFIVVNNTQGRCPSCGEKVTVTNQRFVRYQPPGTIDVDVVDVSATDVSASPNELGSQ